MDLVMPTVRALLRTGVWTALLLTACAALKGDGHAIGAPNQGNRTVSPANKALALRVETDRDYLSGFPMLVAVEIRNITPKRTLLQFMPFDLFDVPGPVGFVARRNGTETLWTASRPPEDPSREDDSPAGIAFRPGATWRALCDLSELHPEIAPGRYDLSGMMAWPEDVASAPVSWEVRAANPKDAAVARNLRTANDRRESSWSAFIRNNWSTPDTSGLSDAARPRLAYYLFLHRAAYGPRAVAQLNPDEPLGFGTGVLESEAAVLRVEILHAGQSPDALTAEKSVLERWPGLAWRIDDIRAGRGLLTSLRTAWGVESSDTPKDKPRPYVTP